MMDYAGKNPPTLQEDKPTTTLRQRVGVNVPGEQQATEQQASVDVLAQPISVNVPEREREALRHILLGSPEAIRQAIHQLHVLNYAESLLWSPISSVGDRISLTPAQGEAMSLLRR